MTDYLENFVRESNMIEGIRRDPTQDEIGAHRHLLRLATIQIGHIEAFVETVAGAELRRRIGMNVRVGNHYPPGGGRHIEIELMSLLAKVSKRKDYYTPYQVHCRYETLHPFMDGNGRSGRALWLWQMRSLNDGNHPPLGFLHTFYYQTLQESR